MTRIDLARITSREAGGLADDGRIIGLIPLGAVEQHGPYLPLATDAIIAEHLGNEIAERLDARVVVAPVLPGGLSSHHLGFPGTVDLPAEIFRGFVRSYIATMTKLGIVDIALFSAHGGNFAEIGALAAEFEGQPDVSLIAYDDLPRYLKVMADAAAEAGLVVPETDAHAGGLETSQVMFLLGEDAVSIPPDLEGYVAAEPGWLDRLLSDGIAALSPIGILGRPAGASARVGACICAGLVGELAEWIATAFGLQLGDASRGTVPTKSR